MAKTKQTQDPQPQKTPQETLELIETKLRYYLLDVILVSPFAQEIRTGKHQNITQVINEREKSGFKTGLEHNDKDTYIQIG